MPGADTSSLDIIRKDATFWSNTEVLALGHNTEVKASSRKEPSSLCPVFELSMEFSISF